jgi:hypothetical protein
MNWMMALVLAGMLQTPQLRTYTLTFNHDGVGTSEYAMEVDGVRQTITPTCTGEGEARLCTALVQITYNVEHSVKVFAVGDFGEAGSLPFECKLPKIPNNTKVQK